MKATILILSIFISFGIEALAHASTEEEVLGLIKKNLGESKLGLFQTIQKAFCSSKRPNEMLKKLSEADIDSYKMEDAGKVRESGYNRYSFMDHFGNQVSANVTPVQITLTDSLSVEVQYVKKVSSQDTVCEFEKATFALQNEALEFDSYGLKNHTIIREPIQDEKSVGECSLPQEDFYFDQVYAAADNQKNVLMAIMDDGFDFNHPALAKRFQDRKDLAKMRLNTPSEVEGHGTEVAGVALKNSHHIQFIPVEAATVKPNGDRSGMYFPHERIQKSALSGARVTNISLGISGKDSSYMKKELGESKDVLFVASAGNDNSNTDIDPHYPSYFSSELDNVVSVAATDQKGKLATFSNFGLQTVDVSAPGEDIETAVPLCMDELTCSEENDGKQDGFKKASGTSVSAPFVSNMAVKVFFINPDLTPSQVKTIIIKTVDQKPWLKGKVKSGGVVNPDRAYQVALETTKTGNNIDAALESVQAHERFMKAMETPLENSQTDKKEGTQLFNDGGRSSLKFRKVE